jgi:hypothetical protein
MPISMNKSVVINGTDLRLDQQSHCPICEACHELANAIIAASRPAHPRKNFKFGYACPSTLLESFLDGSLIH